MDAQATMTVAAVVVALTQMSKWAGVPDGKGPIVVLLLALIGTTFWGWSAGDFGRQNAFAYFSGWIAVALQAAGVYGFTRAASTAVTGLSAPPSGAGASPTVAVERRAD